MESSRESALAVLFDANFLMTAARLHFDLFRRVEERLDSPFEARILSTNLQELKHLSKSSAPLTRNQARVALRLAEFCKVVESPRNEYEPDDALLRFASTTRKTIVATNDAALRTRLRRASCPVLYLRRSGELDLSGYTD